jgi:hypothetical protein
MFNGKTKRKRKKEILVDRYVSTYINDTITTCGILLGIDLQATARFGVEVFMKRRAFGGGG